VTLQAMIEYIIDGNLLAYLLYILLYKWLKYGVIKDQTYTTFWKTKISLKIKVFIWLVKEWNFFNQKQFGQNSLDWQSNMSFL
jgi:hypothetical protein